MGLFSALTNAVSGLSVNQKQIDITSRNVANAGTTGYIRRTLVTKEINASAARSGTVREVTIQRELDRLVQRQLRTENSGLGYTETKADFHARLDQLFGSVGTDTGLDAQFNIFTQSLQQLASDPASLALRSDVLNQGVLLATELNRVSTGVQDLRQEAENRIADEVDAANDAIRGIAAAQTKIVATQDPAAKAALLDERDRLIDELSKRLDIKVLDNGNTISVYTTLGAPLVIDNQASQLRFDERGGINADALYTNSIATRGVGTLQLVNPTLGTIDLLDSGLVRSGSIAALVDLRDNALVDAQAQLDEIAANLSRALSDRSPTPVAATVGAQTGFDIDLAGLQQGNEITLDYTIQPAGTKGTYTFIRVDNPASLPLPPSASANPNDTVVGIDFSGGIGPAVAAIQAALGAGFTVSNPAGNTLRIVDDGAGNTRDVNALSASITNTALTGQGAELPFFVDGAAANAVYTGSLENGPQKRGFAAGIRVNPALLADSSRLVVFNTAPTTPSGDNTRPDLLLQRLTTTARTFDPTTGVGDPNSPIVGSVDKFTRRVVEKQGQLASETGTVDDGQKVVVNALRQKFSDVSGVDVDKEMADLVAVQTVYAANARVVAAVRDLFDTLLRI